MTRAHLLPFWQARAIQSHTAISISDSSMTATATAPRLVWLPGSFFRALPMTIRKPIA